MGIRLKKLKCVCILKSGPTITGRQYLYASGADLSKIDKTAFVEWNHSAHRSPEFIIGEPSDTKIVDDKIYSDINFYTHNRRFNNFEQLKNLYPAIQGYIIKAEGNKVLEFKITAVSLNTTPNGLPALKEYLK